MTEKYERVIETSYGDGKVVFRRSNGEVIAEFSGGASKIPKLLLKYNYNTTVTPPPTSSQIRSDTVPAADTTMIWVHRIDNANLDNKFFFMQMKAGDLLYLQDTDNSDSYAFFKLANDPVDEGSYVTFQVEAEEVSPVPNTGSAIILGIV